MTHKISTEQAPLAVYFCGKENCEPGHAFGPAVRPHYLLHVILEGRGSYHKDGTAYDLRKGDAFLIPPMESSYYQADTENPWSYAWVGFDGKNCKELLSQTVFSDSFVFLNKNPENTDRLLSCMETLVNSFQESHGNQLNPLGNFFLLLSCMQTVSVCKKEDYSHQYFQKAREYIDNNYSYDIRISDIAHHIGIDRTYLYKVFMEQVNLSPKQYLLQHRIRAAAQMLCSSSYTITEIAFSCGFKDAPAFCNYFKKYIGSTPKSFRKNYKAENNG